MSTLVQHSAPDFKATAVTAEGEFDEDPEAPFLRPDGSVLD